MNVNDKIMLRIRFVIDTVNVELKNVCQMLQVSGFKEHIRHRST